MCVALAMLCLGTEADRHTQEGATRVPWTPERPGTTFGDLLTPFKTFRAFLKGLDKVLPGLSGGQGTQEGSRKEPGGAQEVPRGVPGHPLKHFQTF